MLLSSSQYTTTSTMVRATWEKVGETPKLLGMGVAEFDKCNAHKNSKDEKKIATTPKWIIKYSSYDSLQPTIGYIPHSLSYT